MVYTNTANIPLSLNPLRYRGYVYDQETALYYLQSRYYDPYTGRFLNADYLVSPASSFVGTNLFAYCYNNPVNLCDSSGNLPGWITKIWETIKALYDKLTDAEDEVLVVSTSEWMSSSQQMENNLANALNTSKSKTFAATNETFVEQWNSTTANYVVIHTHGSPTSITDNAQFNFRTKDVDQLSSNTNIQYIIITACSVGGSVADGRNMGQMLSTKISPTGYVICSTTTVCGTSTSFWPLDDGKWIIYQNGMQVSSSINSKITMEYIAWYIRHNLN